MASLGFVRWQSAVDFLVLALALYGLLRWARAARALRIALGVVGVHALAVGTRQASLLITSWLLDGLAALALILLLLVFQPELRRLLMQLDRAFRRWPGTQTTGQPHQTDIVDACFALAAARVGALLVLVRRDAIVELLEAGVGLGAEVSSPLLQAIFQKDSPLHDGAVIIDREQITHANVVLPLTHRREVPLAFGTRHRAAMGLAERCDALVVVVSEERGQVSVMDGPAIWEVDPAQLLAVLREASHGKRERLGIRWRRAVAADLPLKVGALGLAAVIWGLTVLASGTTIRTVSVPLEFRNVPRGLEIVDQSADSVDVQLRGSPWIVDALNLGHLLARFDLGNLGPGQHKLAVTPAMLDVPPGVAIGRTAPARIVIRLAPAEPPRRP